MSSITKSVSHTHGCSPYQIFERLSLKKYQPVYFLHGEEVYYTDHLVQFFKRSVLNPEMQQLNLNVLRGREHTVTQVLEFARQFPMKGDHRVVIVKDVQEMEDFRHHTSQKLLERYVKAPQATTLLVWAYRYKILNHQTSLYRALTEKGALVHAAPVPTHKVNAWIQAQAKKRCVSLNHTGVEALRFVTGDDLTLLSEALHKLSGRSVGSDEVGEKEVRSIISSRHSVTVFSVQEALAARSLSKLVHALRETSQNPKQVPLIPLIALLFGFFSKLLIVHTARDQNPASLACSMQVPEYVAKKYLAAAQHYSAEHTKRNLHELYRTELCVKGVLPSYASYIETLHQLMAKLLA